MRRKFWNQGSQSRRNKIRLTGRAGGRSSGDKNPRQGGRVGGSSQVRGSWEVALVRGDLGQPKESQSESRGWSLGAMVAPVPPRGVAGQTLAEMGGKRANKNTGELPRPRLLSSICEAHHHTVCHFSWGHFLAVKPAYKQPQNSAILSASLCLVPSFSHP